MPVNDTTSNRGYQKPNIANTLADDVGRLRSALDSIDGDVHNALTALANEDYGLITGSVTGTDDFGALS